MFAHSFLYSPIFFSIEKTLRKLAATMSSRMSTQLSFRHMLIQSFIISRRAFGTVVGEDSLQTSVSFKATMPQPQSLSNLPYLPYRT